MTYLRQPTSKAFHNTIKIPTYVHLIYKINKSMYVGICSGVEQRL
jgi:hypothetical protein